METASLTSQGLDDLGSKDQLRLLDAVDSLRSQGISQHVSLPQIIVCGDQSSGKSSILEAISGVSFPVKANTGTRFPTELILRRNIVTSVKVSIAPHHSRSDHEKTKLGQFRQELGDFSDLPSLIEKASAVMGILPIGKAFSGDILRVEVSGPDRPHLTIVDLPGVIHSENKYQSEADVQLITDLVKEYMKEPGSIILAVISAKNDYPNQIVLNLARKADPQGLRTLGVITKPDTLKSGSPSERTYLALANNLEVSFHHGWHVLRNRDTDTDGCDLAERDAKEEQFFQSSAWASLQPSQLGIEALRARLSKLMLHQIARELPEWNRKILDELADCKEAQAKLGSPRTTAEQQKQYLVRVSTLFQTLVKAAVDGTYKDPFFGSERSRDGQGNRLRAVIQKANADFASDLSTDGNYYHIVSDIMEPLPSLGHVSIHRDTYVARIMDLNKGRAIPGMFSPLIKAKLFQKQSSPWMGIANQHVMTA